MASRDIDLKQLTCPGCGEPVSFGPGMEVATKRDVASIIARRDYSVALPVECVRCGTKSALDVFAKRATKLSARAIKCPLPGCTGFVSRVDTVPIDHVGEDALEVEGPVSICGECGCVWKRRESLEQEIRSSVVTYPYRTFFYEMTAAEILPVLAMADSALDEQIEDEPRESSDSFVRD